MRIETLCNLFLNTVKRTATDKENMLGIHSNHFLVWMLASTLRRNIDNRAFEQFKQTLLHTLSAYITGN